MKRRTCWRKAGPQDAMNPPLLGKHGIVFIKCVLDNGAQVSQLADKEPVAHNPQVAPRIILIDAAKPRGWKRYRNTGANWFYSRWKATRKKHPFLGHPVRSTNQRKRSLDIYRNSRLATATGSGTHHRANVCRYLTARVPAGANLRKCTQQSLKNRELIIFSLVPKIYQSPILHCQLSDIVEKLNGCTFYHHHRSPVKMKCASWIPQPFSFISVAYV